MSLVVGENELKALLKEKGHSAALVDISVNGRDSLLSDIADVQRDPVTDKFLHVDFHEVSQMEKMTTVVPLEFIGEPIGVRSNGGVLDMARHEVSVRYLPADLPASIRVEIENLNIGDIVHLSDLSVPSGVELIRDHATPVVSCSTVATEVERHEEPSGPADVATGQEKT
jgi:large subunit ribosomal protein L25